MDDEPISQPQSAPVDMSDDSEPTVGPSRVFDISADLNISPVDDSTVEAPVFAPPKAAPIRKAVPIIKPVPKPEPVVLPTSPTIKPPTSAAIPVMPPITKPPISVMPTSPVIPPTPAPAVAPSFQPSENTRSEPANPPTKTIQSGSLARQNKRDLSAMQDTTVHDNPNLKRIRTYESDVAETIQHKQASTASIAIAESKKESNQEVVSNKPPSHVAKNLFMTLVSLIIIAAGLMGLYYLYSISPLAERNTNPIVQSAIPVGLVTSDLRGTLHIDGLRPNDIIARMRTELAKPQPANTIREVIPVENRNGVDTRITGPEMINRMDIAAPDILVRSLTAPWMLGIYSDASGSRSVFVIASTNFFQNAFAGMLQWESVMADDIKQYLAPPSVTGIANTPLTASSTLIQALNPLTNLESILPKTGTSTAKASSTPQQKIASTTPKTNMVATSTAGTTASTTISYPPIQPYLTVRGQFHDRIIRNKDVREFVDSNGKPLFLYSFLDNTKLIITSDEDALSEILIRLEKQAFVR